MKIRDEKDLAKEAARLGARLHEEVTRTVREDVKTDRDFVKLGRSECVAIAAGLGWALASMFSLSDDDIFADLIEIMGESAKNARSDFLAHGKKGRPS